jgi:hypothetical protein
MIESTDICYRCKNFRDLDKINICAECCHGKEDNFEPKDEDKEAL